MRYESRQWLNGRMKNWKHDENISHTSSLKQMIIYRIVCNVYTWFNGIVNVAQPFTLLCPPLGCFILKPLGCGGTAMKCSYIHTLTQNNIKRYSLQRAFWEIFHRYKAFFSLLLLLLSVDPIGNRSKMDFVTPTRLIKFPYYSYYITQKLS